MFELCGLDADYLFNKLISLFFMGHSYFHIYEHPLQLSYGHVNEFWPNKCGQNDVYHFKA